MSFFALLTSCNNVKINQAPETVGDLSSKSLFCAEPPKIIGQTTKILFIVDQSGSNVTGNTTGASPTDPDKSRRKGAIEKFYNSHKGNQYIKWGFISFNVNSTDSFIPASQNYFGDDADLEAAIDQFEAKTDDNGTPYGTALALAQTAIKNDLKLPENDSTNYEIIFMSDGVPNSDQFYSAGNYDYPGLYSLIEDIVKISEGRIHLSTVYYYSESELDLAERMQKMAEHGRGHYLDAGTDGSIDIEDLIQAGTSSEPYVIKDLFIYNLNSTVCVFGGEVGIDSDSDGLCDSDENKLNEMFVNDARLQGKSFSATAKNSFSPTLSDLYIYKNLIGEALPTCTVEDQADEDFDMSNKCEEKFLVNDSPQGPTNIWTNMMLSKAKNAYYDNFDSDGDGLLDGLEFLFFKDKSAALNYNSISRRINGVMNYDLFKQHLSPTRPLSSKPYKVNLVQVEKNDAGQNCYEIDFDQIQTYKASEVRSSQVGNNLDLVHGKDENIIFIYYIMALERNPDSKGILKFSYQKLLYSEKAQKVNFSEGRFDKYVAQ